MSKFLKILPLIFLTVSLLLFVSCKKEKESIKVTGTVIDSTQNAPLSGVEVELSAQVITSGTFSGSFTKLETASTDGSGNFSMEHETVKAAAYKLKFSKTGYFTKETTISADVIQNNDPYDNTYYAYPEAWIKIHIKNANPVNSMDYMYYKFLSGAYSCTGCCNTLLNKFYGTDVDSIQICKTRGGMEVEIQWNVQRGTSSTQYSEKIFCSPFDTTLFDLFY